MGFRKAKKTYIGLRKAKLNKSQREHGTVHSASLRTENLRVYAYAGVGVAVCKFEHRGFEKAKERWDSASLGASKNN
jgi:hypothetical protein